MSTQGGKILKELSLMSPETLGNISPKPTQIA